MRERSLFVRERSHRDTVIWLDKQIDCAHAFVQMLICKNINAKLRPHRNLNVRVFYRRESANSSYGMDDARIAAILISFNSP